MRKFKIFFVFKFLQDLWRIQIFFIPKILDISSKFFKISPPCSSLQTSLWRSNSPLIFYKNPQDFPIFVTSKLLQIFQPWRFRSPKYLYLIPDLKFIGDQTSTPFFFEDWKSKFDSKFKSPKGFWIRVDVA